MVESESYSPFSSYVFHTGHDVSVPQIKSVFLHGKNEASIMLPHCILLSFLLLMK